MRGKEVMVQKGEKDKYEGHGKSKYEEYDFPL
jgi:hypothetical protein